MKNTRLRLHRFEWISSLLGYGMFMVLGVGVLLFQINNNNHPSTANGHTWLFGITIVEFLVLIALTGVFLYKRILSEILLYESILDGLTVPVILTDKDGTISFVSKSARLLILANQDAELKHLSCKHLIDANGRVKRVSWFHNGDKYRTDGNRYMAEDKNGGYIITLFHTQEMEEILDAGGTRGELIMKINTLLKRMGTATEHFTNCANSIAGSSSRQADIISGLSEVITSITSGAIEAPDELNEKMHTVKDKIHQYEQSSGAQTKLMIQTAQALQSACNSIGKMLQDIDQAKKQ